MYNYELKDNHYVVIIDNKKYLLDTGSPTSFWIKNPIREIRINGVTYPLQTRPNNVDYRAICDFVGEDIDGFIGLDIIKQTSLTIYKDNRIDFRSSDINGHIVELDTFGFLSFKAGSNKMVGKYIIDTGAKYGYGVKGLFYDLTPIKEVNDYSPMFKYFSSNLYNVEVVIKGIKKKVEICNSPLVNQMNAFIIANITSLFDEICVLDIKRKVMVLK